MVSDLVQLALISVPPSLDDSTEALRIAQELDAAVHRTYDIALRSYGLLVVNHDSTWGYLHESAMRNESSLTALLTSVYGHHSLSAFKSAADALRKFEAVFLRLESVSGVITAGDLLAGYFDNGPAERLLRGVREAVAIKDECGSNIKEMVNNLKDKAEELESALAIESNLERVAIHAEAGRLMQAKPESLEKIANTINIPSGRRSVRAVAFVALALAGWEPDLDGWEKNVANAIRGDAALKGEYHLPMPLEQSVQTDILPGISLDRRDAYQTLDGTTLLRVETLHIGQDSDCRHVRAKPQPGESFVTLKRVPHGRTAELNWQAVQEFVSHTGPIRHEWTTTVDKVKRIARLCVHRNGLETAKLFRSMTKSIKVSSPELYKIWQKTVSQRSFTSLTCGTMNTAAARAAVVERMVLSTVTDGSCYHIGSYPIYLRVIGGTARLFDADGTMLLVDYGFERFPDQEVYDVGVKFFALLTRAMHGGAVKAGFYKDKIREISVLRAKGPREGLDRKDEDEDYASRAWHQLCESPFPSDNGNSQNHW